MPEDFQTCKSDSSSNQDLYEFHDGDSSPDDNNDDESSSSWRYIASNGKVDSVNLFKNSAFQSFKHSKC